MTFVEEAAELRRQGLAIKEIAAKMQRSERTVQRWLQKAGVTTPGRCDIDTDEVIRMYQDGMTIVEIAKYFDSSHETISKRLTSNGIVCGRSEGIRRHFARTHGEMWNDIKAELDSGTSVYDTSREFHMRYNNVYRLMLQNHYEYDYPDNIDEILDQSVESKATGNTNSIGFDEFVRRSVMVHGDKYDYSRVKFANVKQKVEIVCPVHGSFWQTPEKHMSGQGCPNPECMRVKSMQTIMSKYGVEHPLQNDMVKSRAVDTSLNAYGVVNPMQSDEIKSQIIDIKNCNGTYSTSSYENDLYALLCDTFGNDDVVRQYRSEEYPWACDFYIKSRDLYIELNVSWVHGGHWYLGSQDDLDKVAVWESKFENAYYQSAITCWTFRDVRKRERAAKYNLNYLVFWDKTLSDVREWIAAGCPDGKDWDHEYSWK